MNTNPLSGLPVILAHCMYEEEMMCFIPMYKVSDIYNTLYLSSVTLQLLVVKYTDRFL